ncbi:MAG: T9SS type A sorting domain-containing protein, partial [Bacteroidetes bacterium]|nr:T9SS type A sorting domain-containing protein [Bacteroidota bacterium]
YIVTVTDSLNCQVMDSANVMESLPIVLGFNSTSVTCYGGNNGSIDLMVLGGSSPFTYLWSTTDTSQDITGIMAGSYQVTVTDSTGCSLVDSAVVLQPDSMTLSFNVFDVKPCPDNTNGFIDLSVTGGTQGFGYQYLWSTGSTDEDLLGVGVGSYVVIVTDFVGCTAKKTAVVGGPDPIEIFVSTTDATCLNADGEATIDSVLGGSPPFTYLWSTGSTSLSVANLLAGSYIVIAKDIKQCTNFETVLINNVWPKISVKSAFDVSCSSGSNGGINISITGGTLPYAILWSNGATDSSITGLVAGTYDVTVMDADSCIANESVTIIEPDPLLVVDNTSRSNCGQSNASSTVSVTGGTPPYHYQWSTGIADTFNSVVGLSAGSYFVRVTDNLGCMNVHTITVSDTSAPLIIPLRVDDVRCGESNGLIDIDVIGGQSPYSYDWSNGATSQDIDQLTAGTYSVVVTDLAGCKAAYSSPVNLIPPLTQPICLVTVDDSIFTNLLIWERVNGIAIKHYKVFKEGSQAGIFQLIDSVSADSSGEYLDPFANPLIRAWRYKLSAVDSCGSESALSIFHKTIHLTVNLGVGNTINLIWDGYEGTFPFFTYYISRHKGGGNWVPMDSVPSTNNSWTDLNPPNQGSVFYRVTIDHPDGCHSDSIRGRDYNSTVSNTANQKIDTIIGTRVVNPGFDELAIYPNPTLDILRYEFRSGGRPTSFSYIVYNLLGLKVAERFYNSKLVYHNGSIDMSGFEKGIYIIKVRTDTGTIPAKIILE